MKQRLLVSSILMGLCAGFAGSAFAQNADQPSSDSGKKKETTELQGVTVTGSLIPQAQIETASPVITISAVQIQKQGFGTIYDALKALPIATGTVQDNQTAGGFTQGARSLSLLGLDPGFTLNLINGHPVADYPLQFNGQSNFVDLSSVPIGMVDHIDILPGNQSAIYGSSAIAGVVNIVLKKNVDGLYLNYRVGGYDQGGGSNQRLEITGGHTFDNGLNLTYGLQLANQDPIWGYQRRDQYSNLANPNPAARYGRASYRYSYISNGQSVDNDPGAATCAPLSGGFNNTTRYWNTAAGGTYCGSSEIPGYQTILNGERSAAAYLNTSYKLGDHTELYGTVLFNASSRHYSDGTRVWITNDDLATGGYFFNQSTQQYEQFIRRFSPEETGGFNNTGIRELVRSYNGYFGARGSVGDSKWDYDVYYDRSQTFDGSKQYWPIASKVDAFFEQQFLGPKLGNTTGGYPIYNPNVANFYKPLTPAQYMSFQGLISSKSKTWTQHLNVQLTNTDLFSLPAGSVAIAGVLQVGNQSWTNPIEPLLATPGGYWGRTDVSGAGTRDLYAIGGELQIPIFSTLTANVSARYDKYENNTTGGDSKVTYKLGLEYRPTDAFLFRGSYATAFRAPDMAYTFGGASGFYTSVTDYYRCAELQPGTPLSQCTYNGASLFGTHTGNAGLTSVTAKSSGFGVVWSPNANFNVKADYYDIRIKNEVQLQDIDFLLREELACRTGQMDINSPTCQAVIAQINRNSATAPVPLQLNTITIYPINIASERVSGIVSGLNYKWEAGRYGNFTVAANYNVTLKHTQVLRPGDPAQDLLRNPFVSTEFKSIGNASVTWDIGPWSTTLFGIRYGKTPNFVAFNNPTGYSTPGAGTVAPWILYNGSVAYNFDDNTSMSFTVNNIQNSGPPKDPTNNVPPAPFYNSGNYNPYGRAYWLEMNVKFGGGKG